MKKRIAINKEKWKGKYITIVAMLLIISSLYATSYLLFLRVIDVDVTKDASIIYHGETGSATVKVNNDMRAYNQRIQEFMYSITYTVTPIDKLSNEDVITIRASYDEELAHRYNIHPVNIERKVTVSGLPVRYEHVEDIEEDYLEAIEKSGEEYLEKHQEMILLEDFTTFLRDEEPELKEQKLSYRVFLDAFGAENKDKIVDVYAIQASGFVKGEESDETKEIRDETIYYMVTYNEINTSKQVLEENIFGEKMLALGAYDFSQPESFMQYMQTKYGKQYQIFEMSLTQEKGEK